MTDTTFDIRKIPIEDLRHCYGYEILGVFDDQNYPDNSEERVLVVIRGLCNHALRVSSAGKYGDIEVIRRKPQLKGRVLYRGGTGIFYVSGSTWTEEDFKRDHPRCEFIRIITEIKELPVSEVTND